MKRIAGITLGSLLMGILVTSLFIDTQAEAQPSNAPVASGAHLPAGKELSALQDSCQICHSFDMVTTQRLSAATWKTEVAKMVKFGSPLPKNQESDVVAYLARYLGPAVPRDGATRQAPAPPITRTKSPTVTE